MPDSFNQSGSVLGRIAAEKVRDSKVLDVLSSLSTGKQAYRSVPPLPRPNGSNSPVAPQWGGSGFRGSENDQLPRDSQLSGVQSVAPSESTGIGTNPNSQIGNTYLSPISRPKFNFEPADMRVSLVNDFKDDNEFYMSTGRMPSQVDKMVLNARRKWMIDRGVNPTKQELLYAVQQGLLGYRDSQIGGNRL